MTSAAKVAAGRGEVPAGPVARADPVARAAIAVIVDREDLAGRVAAALAAIAAIADRASVATVAVAVAVAVAEAMNHALGPMANRSHPASPADPGRPTTRVQAP